MCGNQRQAAANDQLAAKERKEHGNFEVALQTKTETIFKTRRNRMRADRKCS
jgi:hypothetical protein